MLNEAALDRYLRNAMNAEDLKPGQHVKHRKGGEYVIVGTGWVEADMSLVVVYRKVDDSALWVRPMAEFIDGRFTKIDGELG